VTPVTHGAHQSAAPIPATRTRDTATLCGVEGIEFRRFRSGEADELADLLAGEVWPYHGAPRVDHADVLRRASEGYYDNASARTFWITQNGSPAGIVRLFDLDDGTPMFDLRVREPFRGKGIGTKALRWLTAYLFTELPSINRIEGTTRQDNLAMRRLFRGCGYVKEAHYRQASPGAGGTVHDAVGYAILRSDWGTGTVTPVGLDE
jgi:RimJ/RimL family protein N-acetyltransferase